VPQAGGQLGGDGIIIVEDPKNGREKILNIIWK
jgi:hypothetical protein